jgi:SAM-dependent methyltransferase
MAQGNLSEDQHNIEIHENYKSWQNKPILQKIYHEFYTRIASYLNNNVEGKIVELGSGIGNMKMVIPQVISTDIFNNPWIDQVENAYKLTFEDNSVSNLILFDVWHHLKYPGDALKEFQRVLKVNGRIIIFEPAMSAVGFTVYGLFHHEPVGITKKISLFAENSIDLFKDEYYAAQGNASRIFSSKKYKSLLNEWDIVKIDKITSLSYALSGGYGKKQLYPDRLFPLMTKIDKIFSLCPVLFSTRLLIVLQKK